MKAPLPLQGRTVTIVGRAQSLLDHGDGARIDASEVVIRVNWPLPVRGPVERTGARTDILLHAYAADVLPRTAVAEGVATWRKDHRLGLKLAAEVGYPKANPRTGVTAVAMVGMAGARRIYLAGYDLYRTGNATPTPPDPAIQRVGGGGHSHAADLALLRCLVDRYECELDPVLEAALREAG